MQQEKSLTHKERVVCALVTSLPGSGQLNSRKHYEDRLSDRDEWDIPTLSQPDPLSPIGLSSKGIKS